MINERGELRFRNTPDYERAADSNRDNYYVFSVRTTDDRYYGTLDVTVTVTPVNDPPTITTTSTSATSLRQAGNRTSRLYTYRATDPEGASTVSWSVGGVDARFFAMDEHGQFSFSETSPPDYEQPGDSGGDNVYNVVVQATDDDSNTARLDVTTTVTDVNEGPEVSGPASLSIQENRYLTNAVYTAIDPEGANVARWNVGGRDGGAFSLPRAAPCTSETCPTRTSRRLRPEQHLRDLHPTLGQQVHRLIPGYWNRHRLGRTAGDQERQQHIVQSAREPRLASLQLQRHRP